MFNFKIRYKYILEQKLTFFLIFGLFQQSTI